MSFALDWDTDAQDALAAIWVQAPDRQAVTAAQGRIDRLLATDPPGNGTPVGEGLYAIQVHPLRELFEVDSRRRRVRVVSVREVT